MAKNLTPQWSPWNWFKNEDTDPLRAAVRRLGSGRDFPLSPYPLSYFSPLSNFYRDIDQMVGNAFGVAPFAGMLGAREFRPSVDIASTDKEYTITVEAPGMDGDDMKIDLSTDGQLTVRGEKKQENEDKEKDYHRIESYYGAFERVLALPEDIEREDIRATCANGVLTITCPRTGQAKRNTRQIEINAGSGRSHAQVSSYSSNENTARTSGPKKAA
jgi:HSP20 family protein